MTLNNETIVHPRLHHLGLTTGSTNPMVEWYRTVLGMSVVHQTSSAAGKHSDEAIKTTWVSNDEANHRLAFVELPGLQSDPIRSRRSRVQHFAFEYRALEELLGTYQRLRGLGILPVLCADQGAQTAFYYKDPDQNIVEVDVDNFGNPWTSSEYIRTSPEFASNPLGVFVDPDKMIAAHDRGATAWEIHVLARSGEFVPDKPYSLQVFM
ncbi:biphenyl-2,3-diol 1,2-dioxygenase [Rhizobiaceae bacterium CRRU44]|uniref:Biphenyl-2,3-diol 1,2-dioxygenase n=1 Tax=Ferranicluibacter rubi TaxID=2715133 RepID=A0AA44CBY5_9HYPH|nr:VOC family protein [Ferranicluibacter rubi]NHT77613.1 biphenyl-2,3-diol 1,2-dioxygenase [Ferranicluibacter rubi]